MDWVVRAGPETGQTGVVTDMIAVMEMQNILAAKPKQPSISGSVRTRHLSVVLHLSETFFVVI